MGRITARLGLWRARARRWGTMRLTTIGRRSGQERSVILDYLEDGTRAGALFLTLMAVALPLLVITTFLVTAFGNNVGG